MDKHKQGISTISMGWHPRHTLLAFAESHAISPLEAASHVRQLCQENKLSIICLGSFDNFEGSTSPLSERLALAQEWVNIAHALGTDIIQVPSNDDKAAIGDIEILVSELKELADLGKKASPAVSFAYEALAWGTHVADWEESLRIVKLVDRDNFGLCLDAYHVLSRLWADARSESGRRPGGAAALNASIKHFLDECPVDRIIYIQLSDAEKCRPPLLPGHPAYSTDKDSTHSWCSWGRLFPCEEAEGGYLPMADLCKAWLITKGFKGWVSLEIFHRKMQEEQADPEYWAGRGKASWHKLVQLLA